MDSASEFLRMLQHERSLATANRSIPPLPGHDHPIADVFLLPGQARDTCRCVRGAASPEAR